MALFKEEDDSLKASIEFEDFSQAFAFMSEVAHLAERQQHHPNWSNVYNQVDIALSTHDEGGIVTEKDRKLAQAIEGIYQRYK